MRQNVFKTRAMLSSRLMGTALLLSAAASFAATPTLGADCGSGATIVGSDAAGKVTLGTRVSSCTLTFSVPYPNAPACAAMNETNQGAGQARPIGARSTNTTLVLDPWNDGDTLSYMCVGY